MIDKRSKDEPPYKVGYRRPPKEGQFKPGKSGNPRGRPKGKRPISVVIQEILDQKVSITENGATRLGPE
jgi:Family of unknown function (DUF5681)